MELFGVNIPLWIPFLLLIILLLRKHMRSRFYILERMGVPGPSLWTIGGTFFSFMKYGIANYDEYLLKTYGKIVGTSVFTQPMLLIFDPEMLKQILVKDFNNFRNRSKVGFVTDFPLSESLLGLDDHHWKQVRSLISPTFSGSKLRKMIGMINKCSRTLVENLSEPVKAGDSFECKEYSGSFTMDVIASTAFGLDVDAKKDKNNRFVCMASKFVDIKFTRPLFLIMVLFPFLKSFLIKWCGASMFDKEAVKFFVDVVNQAMEVREKGNQQESTDFLQLMISSQGDDLTMKDTDSTEKNKNKLVLTHAQILANALVFFLAGYDTTSTALTMTMYSLAINQEAQEMAYKNICDVLGDKNEPDYDDIKQMTYLEMCIEESMRMYPPVPRVDRKTACDTTIGELRIPAGMMVGIPIKALHSDPGAWPEPEKFIPERFTAEAKQNRHPFQYLPFGLGPRNCVGMRFALLELKMALVHILKSYRLTTSQKTEIPMKMKKIKIEGVNGAWIKAEPRD